MNGTSRDRQPPQWAPLSAFACGACVALTLDLSRPGADGDQQLRHFADVALDELLGVPMEREK